MVLLHLVGLNDASPASGLVLVEGSLVQVKIHVALVDESLLGCSSFGVDYVLSR